MARQEELIAGETVLIRVLRHPVVLVARCWASVLLAILVLVGGALLPLAANLTTIRWFAILGVDLVLLVYIDLQYIIWRSESYTVTNHRVLLQRGVLGKFSKSISFNRIQDVTTFQRLFGRLLGYGTLEIESAGKDGAEILTYLPSPDNFRNAIVQELHPEGAAPASV